MNAILRNPPPTRADHLDEIEAYVKDRAATTSGGKYPASDWLVDGFTMSRDQAESALKHLRSGDSKALADLLYNALMLSYYDDAHEYAQMRRARDLDEVMRGVAKGI